MNDNENWYALRVRPRHEKAIAGRLSEKYEIFLPLLVKYNKWSDRIKKIETPLFSGYLFIKTSIKMKYFILEEQGVSSFVQFAGNPAIIREKEIQAIRFMLDKPSNLEIKDGYAYSKGENVQITRGAFAGIEGRVVKIKNRSRLYVGIEQLGKIISVEIDTELIEKK